MADSIISFVYLFGAAQALLLILGLNLNKPLFSDLKKITSLLLLTMMIVMIYYVVLLNNYETIYPYIDSLGSASWMAIAPLYYLLFRSIQEPRWKLTWKALRYFPFALIFMIEGLLTTLGLPVWLHYYITDAQVYLDLWMAAFFGSSFYFIAHSILLYREEEEPQNKMLIWFSYLFLGVLAVFSIVYMFIRQHYFYWFELTLLALFEIFIFVLVYRTFKVMPFRQFFELSKYDNNELSKKQLQSLAEKLQRVMDEEQPYLDKKLSLNALSKHCTINTNDLSQLFNLHYKSNFYEFINQYRLRHLEKMILDAKYDQYKIIALAEESGFNSKATFYKVFKEKHQLTPSQFIKKYKER